MWSCFLANFLWARTLLGGTVPNVARWLVAGSLAHMAGLALAWHVADKIFCLESHFQTLGFTRKSDQENHMYTDRAGDGPTC